MTRYCYIYSEQDLTPRAADTIKKIKQENGWGDVQFIEYRNTPNVKRVLVFGRQKPEVAQPGVEYVHTYSVAQIMTKANAITVLSAAMQMYFEGKHEPTVKDDDRWVHTGWDSPVYYGFAYDKPVAIDIETDGNLGNTHTPDEVNIISIAMYDGGAIPIVWANPNPDKTSERKLLPLSDSQIAMFRRELPKYTKGIYHNGKFDTRVLNRVLGVELCVWFDTMLAHHVLNMAAGEHGLKALAMRYLGAEDWEGGIKSYLKSGAYYERIPVDKIGQYNGWDVYWTYRLWELFAPQIEADDNNQMAFELEMAEARLLLKVEQVGIPFSMGNANVLALRKQSEMEHARVRLQAITAKPAFNPNSPKQVKEWFHAQGFMVTTTNVETVESVMDDLDEDDLVYRFCKELLTYRKASKVKGTYADGWAKQARWDDESDQFRVHPTFLVHGTSTGRLSSTGPNAQNMPRDKEVRMIVALTSVKE